MTAPNWDEIFAVMSSASVGDMAARVAIPADAQFEGDDVATRFAAALNILLDDLSFREAERRRGERASARLASIVSSSVDAILGETLDGTITDWNAAAERLYGYSPEEAIGQPVGMLVAPEKTDEARLLVARAAQGEPIMQYETERRRKDGSTVDVSLSISPTRDGHGQITGVAVIARDITETKAVEARFRGMVDAALDAFVGIDAAGNVVEWSRQAETIFGWTREEVLQRPLAGFIIPERYRAAHLAGLERFRRTGEGAVLRKRLELEAVARDGREFPVELTIAPAETRGVVVFSAFIRDITERRHQERALKALHDVAFATSHAMDPERLAEFTVAQAREVLGIQTAALYHWDEAEGVLRLAARSHAGEEPGLERVLPGQGLSGMAFERREPVVVPDYASWPHRVQSGGRMITCGIAVPLMVGARVLGTLIVSSYMPHTLRPSDVEFLTLFASEVAPALEASRLLHVEQRQKIIEEASLAKSHFLANMSHELRTPLNAILGFSELLAEQLAESLTEAQRRYLRNVRDSGEHLLELINDVLDLSKVEAGRLELRAEVVNLAPLLEPVVASTRVSAERSGIGFAATTLSDGIVRVDPARLRQILYNLLSNAVKFTPRGGAVRLGTHFTADDLIIDVVDTGLGIPKAEHHRVFGTFERLHEGRSQAAGTGLGLALTKRLVELHGGSIVFESEEGRGTTFRVVVPNVRIDPVHGDRILIVEDVKSDADLIGALVAEVGLRSEVTTTVHGAIDAVRRDPPRGVVLDLRLPDERGERVLEALKADDRTRGIPVIVVTVEDDEGRSRPLGADDHLTKPIDRGRLAAWLGRLRPSADA